MRKDVTFDTDDRKGIDNIPSSLNLCYYIVTPFTSENKVSKWSSKENLIPKQRLSLLSRSGTRALNPGFRSSLITSRHHCPEESRKLDCQGTHSEPRRTISEEIWFLGNWRGWSDLTVIVQHFTWSNAKSDLKSFKVLDKYDFSAIHWTWVIWSLLWCTHYKAMLSPVLSPWSFGFNQMNTPRQLLRHIFVIPGETCPSKLIAFLFHNTSHVFTSTPHPKAR